MILSLSACATVPVPPQAPQTPVQTAPQPAPISGTVLKDAPIAQPSPIPPSIPRVTAPPPPSKLPPEVEIIETPKWYAHLAHWKDSDQALKSFQRSCASFAKAKMSKLLNPQQPQYGRYVDWMPA
ncbi:hypothetical protein N9W89_14595, partial [Hellea sp.]|nr:hypothetical protein [Hellea sp.]